MKPLILLIEPNEEEAEIYKNILEISNFRIKTAPTMASAVACADAKKPDLVILEIELAQHNGIEFLYEFRSYADWLLIPIIIYSRVSASKFKPMRRQLRELGINNYLEKTNSGLNELVKTIQNELENVRATSN